jgi:hypothetical protein
MTEGLSYTGPEDRNSINVHRPEELRYWTQSLGVDEQTLLRAVSAVGNNVDTVRDYLERTSHEAR